MVFPNVSFVAEDVPLYSFFQCFNEFVWNERALNENFDICNLKKAIFNISEVKANGGPIEDKRPKNTKIRPK